MRNGGYYRRRFGTLRSVSGRTNEHLTSRLWDAGCIPNRQRLGDNRLASAAEWQEAGVWKWLHEVLADEAAGSDGDDVGCEE
jgi:hypothetical protein